jgi:hypothetical protein
VAARTVVARGRVGRRVGEWQRRVGPGEGDSPQVRVPLGRASGPGVRPVGPSSRARWVRVAPVSAQRSAHSAPNRPDSPHFCARLGHFSARLGHSFVRLEHFSARLGHSFVRLGHLSGRLGRALYLWLRKLPGFGADALHDSRCRAARVCHEGGAGLSPCARNTIREAISRDTSSSQHAGHAARRNRTRSAAGTFSRSPPAQSGDLPPEVWLPTLSDDERLFEEHARSRGVEEPLVFGESRQTHFWWQILRLRWR